MLKGVSPLLSPQLLSVLSEMGHGDEIVLADAHFPSASVGRRVIRADGLRIPELLEAILPLFELDAYVEAPVAMMAVAPGDLGGPGSRGQLPSGHPSPRAARQGAREGRAFRLL